MVVKLELQAFRVIMSADKAALVVFEAIQCCGSHLKKSTRWSSRGRITIFNSLTNSGNQYKLKILVAQQIYL